jgi:hypothetical protein
MIRGLTGYDSNSIHVLQEAKDALIGSKDAQLATQGCMLDEQEQTIRRQRCAVRISICLYGGFSQRLENNLFMTSLSSVLMRRELLQAKEMHKVQLLQHLRRAQMAANALRRLREQLFSFDAGAMHPKGGLQEAASSKRAAAEQGLVEMVGRVRLEMACV